MIHVIASIRVKNGMIPEFLEIFKNNVPMVRKEKGCIEYLPTLDIDAALPPQVLDEHVITIIERWESPQALHDHLQTPHMLAYRKKTKEMVTDISLKVLQDA